MKQLAIILTTLAVSSLAHGADGVIDTFDSYSDESRVQNQKIELGAWSAPSGMGVADGMTSVYDGAQKRGASLSVNWAGGAVARNRFVFAKPQVYQTGVSFTFDLAAKPVQEGTSVYVTVRSVSGAEWRTEARPVSTDSAPVKKPGASSASGAAPAAKSTNAALPAGYAHYVFTFDEASTTRAAGTESLKEVLGNVSNILIQFTNTSGAGSQQLVLDNLAVKSATKVGGAK